MIKDNGGKEKVPDVYFRAEDSVRDEIKIYEWEDEQIEEESEEGSDEQMVDGERIKTGKIENKEEDTNTQVGKKEALQDKLRGGAGEGGVESYSGKGRERDAPDEEARFVRWSSSTEIGDFIRDAARGKEFAVEIEGASKEIRVGVPSFNDRTHYLRVRLRKTGKRLEEFASIKKTCDDLAHRSAQRLAMGGFGILVSWWLGTYYFTFMTSYGWDTMEPVTVCFLGYSSIPSSITRVWY